MAKKRFQFWSNDKTVKVIKDISNKLEISQQELIVTLLKLSKHRLAKQNKELEPILKDYFDKIV